MDGDAQNQLMLGVRFEQPVQLRKQVRDWRAASFLPGRGKITMTEECRQPSKLQTRPVSYIHRNSCEFLEVGTFLLP